MITPEAFFWNWNGSELTFFWWTSTLFTITICDLVQKLHQFCQLKRVSRAQLRQPQVVEPNSKFAETK